MGTGVKVHHCMVDGVSATDLLSVMLDREREPERGPVPPWTPAREPSAGELFTQPLVRRLATPVDALAAAGGMIGGPRDAAELALQTATGTAAMRSLLRLAPRSSLNGAIGPHRRWDWANARLSDVKTVRAGLGGTVNDVVLASILGGFRELLISRGEDPGRMIVRSLVPVSVRRPGERGTYNNRVSAMFARLPVGVDDPVERLASVRSQMEDLKRSKQAVAGEVLVSLSGFAPAVLPTLGTRLAFRLPQRSINTVTTNVLGPQQPLYLARRRLLESIPFVPLAGHVRMGVAIFSYDGSFKFGVTGDWDTAPDIRVLCEAIERAMAELVQAAQQPASRPARRPKARQPASAT